MVRIKKDASGESAEEKPKKGFSIKRVEKNDHAASNRTKNHGEATRVTDPDDAADRGGFVGSAGYGHDDRTESPTDETAAKTPNGGLFSGKKNSDGTPRDTKNPRMPVKNPGKKETSQIARHSQVVQ